MRNSIIAKPWPAVNGESGITVTRPCPCFHGLEVSEDIDITGYSLKQDAKKVVI